MFYLAINTFSLSLSLSLSYSKDFSFMSLGFIVLITPSKVFRSWILRLTQYGASFRLHHANQIDLHGFFPNLVQLNTCIQGCVACNDFWTGTMYIIQHKLWCTPCRTWSSLWIIFIICNNYHLQKEVSHVMIFHSEVYSVDILDNPCSLTPPHTHVPIHSLCYHCLCNELNLRIALASKL